MFGFKEFKGYICIENDQFSSIFRSCFILLATFEVFKVMKEIKALERRFRWLLREYKKSKNIVILANMLDLNEEYREINQRGDLFEINNALDIKPPEQNFL